MNLTAQTATKPTDLPPATSSARSMEEVFKELFLPLVWYIHKMISNREISEDIAQEVMLRYWTKFRERDCHKLAKGYLYQSAYHAAIDYLRREKVERKRLHSYLSRQKDFEMIEDLMTQREIQRGINRVMNGLPKKCREVFQLSREEGLSYGQIALRMSISIKTVETQMSKALKRFRTELSRVY